jgi:hypothetical protein
VRPNPIALPGLPPVAIYTYPGGGTPWIMASDHVHDVVGLTFDPVQGFREWFRVRDASRAMLSAPSVLFDAHTALGTNTGEVVFVGPNQSQLSPVNAFGGTTNPEYAAQLFASLTRIAETLLHGYAKCLNLLNFLTHHLFAKSLMELDSGCIHATKSRAPSTTRRCKTPAKLPQIARELNASRDRSTILDLAGRHPGYVGSSALDVGIAVDVV